MKKKKYPVLFWFVLILSLRIQANPEPLRNQKPQVCRLRVEYAVHPMGIDVLQPRLSWEIISTVNNTRQIAWEIRCAGSAKNLTQPSKRLWDSKKQLSSQSNQIIYGGPPLHSRQRVYWQVRIWDNHNRVSAWSTPSWWEMGLLSPDDWKAQWIETAQPVSKNHPLPSPYLRKDFTVKKNVHSARLYLTAHGLYRAEIDGRPVSDHLFTPGWTSYNKRLQYQVFDLTGKLTPGRHTLGAILGEGWYLGAFSWNNVRNYYGNHMGLLAQLEIRYSDGSREVVVTDDSWKYATGPILKSEIYHGEIYDARKELSGWSSPGYDDHSWKPVVTASYPTDILTATVGPPVKRIGEITPVAIFTAPNGDTLVDMGQNMVGWIRLEASGPAGTRITLRHGEVLDRQGNLYTDNLRSAKQMVVYYLKGQGEEVFEPHFTFQGFRYVAVSGYPDKLTPGSLTGIVIHSDLQPSGSFECSDTLINQLQHNIVWGLKGNFLDVPTDCPQRDERMGWTGDAQVFAPTACFNMDAASFYTKWLKDLRADQHPDGVVPHVIPDVISGGGSTGWADACVIIPWTLYRYYGDRRILEEQYGSMKSWVNYMKRQAGNNFLWTTGNHFGDWLAFATNRSDYPGATTDKDFLATAYFAYSSGLLAKIARILGYDADALQYAQLHNQVKKAFQKEFLTPNGRLSPNTQTAYVLALNLNLLPDSLIPKAAARLAADVNRFGHITTGFLGTSGLNPALSAHGYWDEAFKLLMRKQYPSWLYPVTRGATTIWERWDGIKPDGSFQNPGMNSFNHYAYGAIGNWIYQQIGGIQPDPEIPGYKQFIIHPHPGGGITWAKTSYHSLYGEIRSEWHLANGVLELDVTVPPNTRARIILPGNNKPGIHEVGSGRYHFQGGALSISF